MMEVIDRILELAKQNQITANKVAVECKLGSSAMTNWKKGIKKPSIEPLIKIADYFNVSLDYLVGRQELPDTTPQIPPDIAKMWAFMDFKQQAEVRGFMRGMIIADNREKEKA